MRPRIALVVCPALAVLALAAAAAADPAWRGFTARDGLAASWVTFVSLNPDGTLTLSHDGVDAFTLYDGYRFERHPSPGRGLRVRRSPSGQTWALLRDGRTGALAGLQQFRDGVWVPYPIPDLPRDPLPGQPFLAWRDDLVLLLFADRVLLFDARQRTVSLVRHAGEGSLRSFSGIAAGADGSAWIAAEGGLAVLRPDPAAPAGVQWNEYTGPEVFPPLAPPSIAGGPDDWYVIGALAHRSPQEWRTSAGVWWAGRRPGGFTLFHRDLAGTFEHRVEANRVLTGTLNDIAAAPDGTLWIGTSEGLARYAPPLWQPVSGLPDPGAIAALARAEDGRLFAAADGALLVWDGRRWERVAVGGIGATLSGIALDPSREARIGPLPDGRVLIEASGPLAVIDPSSGIAEPVRHPQGRLVTLLGPDGPGRYLVGTTVAGTAGWRLETFNGHAFSTLLDLPPASAARPSAAIRASTGELWIAHPAWAGPATVREGRVTIFGPAEGYDAGAPTQLREVGPGRVWLAAGRRLVEFDGRRFRDIRETPEPITAMASSLGGTAWVAAGGEIHRYRDGLWTVHARDEGLPDASFRDIVEDATGAVWVASTAGLSRFDATLDQTPPETFVPEDNPREVASRSLARFVVAGADRWQQTGDGRLFFSWRIDADRWSPFQPSTAIALEGLRSGAHLLEVRAMDRNGNIDSTPAVWMFTVRRPWYARATTVVPTAVALVLIGMILASHVSRHRQLGRALERRNAELGQAIGRLQDEIAARQRIEQELATFDPGRSDETIGAESRH